MLSGHGISTRWKKMRDGALHVPFGKAENARRTIPLTPRLLALMDMRSAFANSEWAISRADPQRAHRKIHAKKAAPKSVSNRQGCTVLALHVPAHLPHALGGVHGPTHVSGGAQRFLHDAPLPLSTGGNDTGSQGLWGEYTG